jgi:N-methylhydantoinase B
MREPEAVRYDVQCGLVSLAAAAAEYGVVLIPGGDPDDVRVDEVATHTRRAELRAARGPLPMFDRGPYFRTVRETTGIVRPTGWPDPDEGFFAQEVAP